jgi:2-polyprenyl-3-methyl-5-hydroxy-6-metoxy-1,4-benzoquinol methylase
MFKLFSEKVSVTQQINTTIVSNRYRDSLKKVLLKNCYEWISINSELPKDLLNDIEDHLCNRIVNVENCLIPWLTEVTDLKDKIILEVGCGTGSMTVPFALRADFVVACDVWETIEVAKERVRLFQCDNVDFYLNDFDWLNDEKDIKNFYKKLPPFDIITFDAVLEHLTISERLKLLRTTWENLKVGGLILIYETPNRLAYYDSHTYLTHFFHSLPDDLAKLYALEIARRDTFNDELKQNNWQERLYKSGRGVSYHEFELTMDFDKLTVIADGTSNYLKPETEHRYYQVLRDIIESELPHIPVGFTTEWLNLIIRKDYE